MEHNAFKVYKTSAGAGKTYAIVREFIILSMLENKQVRSILAMTFTNKAANEMKDRIIEYLFEIKSQTNYDEHIKELVDSIAMQTNTSVQEVQIAASEILQTILHQYNQFSVSTIDSFIHDLLRTFSRDLRLPDNFTVELDKEVFINNIVTELYLQLGKEEVHLAQDITNYVIDFSLQELEENEQWDITYLLKQNAELLFTEEGMQYIPHLARIPLHMYTQTISTIRKQLKEHADFVKTKAEKAMETIANAGLSIQDFFQTSNGIGGFFLKLKNYYPGSPIKKNSYVRKTIEEGIWTKKNPEKDIPEEIKMKLTEIFNEIFLHPLTPHVVLLQYIRKSLTPMALTGYMQQLFDSYKEQESIIHISEFNKYISDIVRNEPAPFIYERIGQYYKHFLLDEFQDTSIMQWHNILPLTDNAFAQNQSTTFIVGDIKQAIYRFRNSEMQQLMDLPKIFAKHLSGSHYNDIEVNLNNRFFDVTTLPDFKNTNYRSGEHIVTFNNIHFDWIHRHYDNLKTNSFIINAYTNVSQNTDSRKDGRGLVQIHTLEKENYTQLSLDRIVHIIHSLSKKHEDTKRYNHIAILTRSNTHGKLIARHLMQLEQPIPVISTESLELSFSPKVNFLIDLLKIIENNYNHLAIANAISYIYQYYQMPEHINSFGYHTEQIFSTTQKPFVTFEELLKELQIYINWEYLPYLHLNTSVSHLIHACSFDSMPDPYILFFQNSVIDYTKQNSSSLGDFIEWWEITGKHTSIIVPEGANAVKILSVHKSKGLQFDNVIYPFADFPLLKTNRKIWVSKSELPQTVQETISFPDKLEHFFISPNAFTDDDEQKTIDFLDTEMQKQELDGLNIHYVAMTRAKNKLFVLTKNEELSNMKFSRINHILHHFIQEKKLEHTFWNSKDDEAGIYTFGQEISETTDKPEDITAHSKPVLHSYFLQTDAAKTLNVKRNIMYRNISKLQIGIQLHFFLSQINSLNDILNEFNSFCIKHNIGKTEQEAMQSMLRQLTEDKQLANTIFSNDFKSANEVSILSKSGIYRPDKLIWTDGGITVVDFKTGIPEKKHINQISNYKELLKEMSYQVNESYIIYLNEDGIQTKIV